MKNEVAVTSLEVSCLQSLRVGTTETSAFFIGISIGSSSTPALGMVHDYVGPSVHGVQESFAGLGMSENELATNVSFLCRRRNLRLRKHGWRPALRKTGAQDPLACVRA